MIQQSENSKLTESWHPPGQFTLGSSFGLSAPTQNFFPNLYFSLPLTVFYGFIGLFKIFSQPRNGPLVKESRGLYKSDRPLVGA